jgi:hypothetical protein
MRNKGKNFNFCGCCSRRLPPGSSFCWEVPRVRCVQSTDRLEPTAKRVYRARVEPLGVTCLS